MKPGNLIFRDVLFIYIILNRIKLNFTTFKITCDFSTLIKNGHQHRVRSQSRSKTLVCGPSLAGIASWNLAGCMDICLL
jgi:hypothetical protein